MRITKKMLIIGLSSGMLVLSTQLQAEVKGNIRVVSNYM